MAYTVLHSTQLVPTIVRVALKLPEDFFFSTNSSTCCSTISAFLGPFIDVKNDHDGERNGCQESLHECSGEDERAPVAQGCADNSDVTDLERKDLAHRFTLLCQAMEYYAHLAIDCDFANNPVDRDHNRMSGDRQEGPKWKGEICGDRVYQSVCLSELMKNMLESVPPFHRPRVLLTIIIAIRDLFLKCSSILTHVVKTRGCVNTGISEVSQQSGMTDLFNYAVGNMLNGWGLLFLSSNFAYSWRESAPHDLGRDSSNRREINDFDRCMSLFRSVLASFVTSALPQSRFSAQAEEGTVPLMKCCNGHVNTRNVHVGSEVDALTAGVLIKKLVITLRDAIKCESDEADMGGHVAVHFERRSCQSIWTGDHRFSHLALLRFDACLAILIGVVKTLAKNRKGGAFLPINGNHDIGCKRVYGCSLDSDQESSFFLPLRTAILAAIVHDRRHHSRSFRQICQHLLPPIFDLTGVREAKIFLLSLLNCIVSKIKSTDDGFTTYDFDENYIEANPTKSSGAIGSYSRHQSPFSAQSSPTSATHSACPPEAYDLCLHFVDILYPNSSAVSGGRPFLSPGSKDQERHEYGKCDSFTCDENVDDEIEALLWACRPSPSGPDQNSYSHPSPLDSSGKISFLSLSQISCTEPFAPSASSARADSWTACQSRLDIRWHLIVSGMVSKNAAVRRRSRFFLQRLVTQAVTAVRLAFAAGRTTLSSTNSSSASQKLLSRSFGPYWYQVFEKSMDQRYEEGSKQLIGNSSGRRDGNVCVKGQRRRGCGGMIDEIERAWKLIDCLFDCVEDFSVHSIKSNTKHISEFIQLCQNWSLAFFHPSKASVSKSTSTCIAAPAPSSPAALSSTYHLGPPLLFDLAFWAECFYCRTFEHDNANIGRFALTHLLYSVSPSSTLGTSPASAGATGVGWSHEFVLDKIMPLLSQPSFFSRADCYEIEDGTFRFYSSWLNSSSNRQLSIKLYAEKLSYHVFHFTPFRLFLSILASFPSSHATQEKLSSSKCRPKSFSRLSILSPRARPSSPFVFRTTEKSIPSSHAIDNFDVVIRMVTKQVLGNPQTLRRELFGRLIAGVMPHLKPFTLSPLHFCLFLGFLPRSIFLSNFYSLIDLMLINFALLDDGATEDLCRSTREIFVVMTNGHFGKRPCKEVGEKNQSRFDDGRYNNALLPTRSSFIRSASRGIARFLRLMWEIGRPISEKRPHEASSQSPTLITASSSIVMELLRSVFVQDLPNLASLFDKEKEVHGTELGTPDSSTRGKNEAPINRSKGGEIVSAHFRLSLFLEIILLFCESFDVGDTITEDSTDAISGGIDKIDDHSRVHLDGDPRGAGGIETSSSSLSWSASPRRPSLSNRSPLPVRSNLCSPGRRRDPSFPCLKKLIEFFGGSIHRISEGIMSYVYYEACLGLFQQVMDMRSLSSSPTAALSAACLCHFTNLYSTIIRRLSMALGGNLPHCDSLCAMCLRVLENYGFHPERQKSMIESVAVATSCSLLSALTLSLPSDSMKWQVSLSLLSVSLNRSLFGSHNHGRVATRISENVDVEISSRHHNTGVTGVNEDQGLVATVPGENYENCVTLIENPWELLDIYDSTPDSNAGVGGDCGTDYGAGYGGMDLPAESRSPSASLEPPEPHNLTNNEIRYFLKYYSDSATEFGSRVNIKEYGEASWRGWEAVKDATLWSTWNCFFVLGKYTNFCVFDFPVLKSNYLTNDCQENDSEKGLEIGRSRRSEKGCERTNFDPRSDSCMFRDTFSISSLPRSLQEVACRGCLLDRSSSSPGDPVKAVEIAEDRWKKAMVEFRVPPPFPHPSLHRVAAYLVDQVEKVSAYGGLELYKAIRCFSIPILFSSTQSIYLWFEGQREERDLLSKRLSMLNHDDLDNNKSDHSGGRDHNETFTERELTDKEKGTAQLIHVVDNDKDALGIKFITDDGEDGKDWRRKKKFFIEYKKTSRRVIEGLVEAALQSISSAKEAFLPSELVLEMTLTLFHPLLWRAENCLYPCVNSSGKKLNRLDVQRGYDDGGSEEYSSETCDSVEDDGGKDDFVGEAQARECTGIQRLVRLGEDDGGEILTKSDDPKIGKYRGTIPIASADSLFSFRHRPLSSFLERAIHAGCYSLAIARATIVPVLSAISILVSKGAEVMGESGCLDEEKGRPTSPPLPALCPIPISWQQTLLPIKWSATLVATLAHLLCFREYSLADGAHNVVLTDVFEEKWILSQRRVDAVQTKSRSGGKVVHLEGIDFHAASERQNGGKCCPFVEKSGEDFPLLPALEPFRGTTAFSRLFVLSFLDSLESMVDDERVRTQRNYLGGSTNEIETEGIKESDGEVNYRTCTRRKSGTVQEQKNNSLLSHATDLHTACPLASLIGGVMVYLLEILMTVNRSHHQYRKDASGDESDDEDFSDMCGGSINSKKASTDKRKTRKVIADVTSSICPSLVPPAAKLRVRNRCNVFDGTRDADKEEKTVQQKGLVRKEASPPSVPAPMPNSVQHRIQLRGWQALCCLTKYLPYLLPSVVVRINKLTWKLLRHNSLPDVRSYMELFSCRLLDSAPKLLMMNILPPEPEKPRAQNDIERRRYGTVSNTGDSIHHVNISSEIMAAVDSAYISLCDALKEFQAAAQCCASYLVLAAHVLLYSDGVETTDENCGENGFLASLDDRVANEHSNEVEKLEIRAKQLVMTKLREARNQIFVAILPYLTSNGAYVRGIAQHVVFEALQKMPSEEEGKTHEKDERMRLTVADKPVKDSGKIHQPSEKLPPYERSPSRFSPPLFSHASACPAPSLFASDLLKGLFSYLRSAKECKNMRRRVSKDFSLWKDAETRCSLDQLLCRPLDGGYNTKTDCFPSTKEKYSTNTKASFAGANPQSEADYSTRSTPNGAEANYTYHCASLSNRAMSQSINDLLPSVQRQPQDDIDCSDGDFRPSFCLVTTLKESIKQEMAEAWHYEDMQDDERATVKMHFFDENRWKDRPASPRRSHVSDITIKPECSVKSDMETNLKGILKEGRAVDDGSEYDVIALNDLERNCGFSDIRYQKKFAPFKIPQGVEKLWTQASEKAPKGVDCETVTVKDAGDKELGKSARTNGDRCIGENYGHIAAAPKQNGDEAFPQQARWKEREGSPPQYGSDHIFELCCQLMDQSDRQYCKGNDSAELVEERRDYGTRSRNELIVIASLIDRVPNLAGLTRTCEIFNVKQLVLHSKNVQADPQYQSIAVSAHLWMPTTEVRVDELPMYLNNLKNEGYTVVGLEQSSETKKLGSEEISLPFRCALLLGREKEGIPSDLFPFLDLCVEIPQVGMIRSLNVHVSGALFIWEYFRQHGLNAITNNEIPRDVDGKITGG